MSSRRYGDIKHVPVNPALREYLLRSTTVDPVIAELVDRTAQLGDLAVMLIPAEQAALLTVLTLLTTARTAVDVGTFTGASALAMARGLAPDGQVITCDITDKWLDIARDHWQRAGVADRIDFRLGPAAETLAALTGDRTVDIAFLDADKESYAQYHELLIPLLRPGGLLVVDNVFFNGYVLDPALAAEGIERASATALRSYNAALAADDRLMSVMLPISDGLTIARKKSLTTLSD
jgi:predicted O-methyltransferase YrrM